jgi:hypothetical protein
MTVFLFTKEDKMWRQGDLLIIKVDKIPKGAVKQHNRILAEGEVTGHIHELNKGDLYLDADGFLYFKTPENETVTLSHQEHKAIDFDAGDYIVLRQREYTPTGWKQVAD